MGIISADHVNYEAGQSYVVSGYIKTENTTDKALIKIEFINSEGKPLNEHTKFAYGLKGTHDWTMVNTNIDNAPEGTKEIRISVGLNPGTGTAYFDGIQLEKGTVVSTYNLIENAGFERADAQGTLPLHWEFSNLSANDKLDENAGSEDDKVYKGTKSFKITGQAGKNKYIKQRINISGDQNTDLTLSGWAKHEGANPSGGKYTLQVQVNYAGGTSETFANDFSKTDEGWQHVATKVKPTAAFTSIDVYYLYYNQAGTTWFDAMRLETGASITKYTYDAKENDITKIVDPLGNNVQYGYDGLGNQTSITDGKGKITSFAYDKRNLLTRVTDAKNNITNYGYDNAGNRTTVTDARNKITTYNYNEFNQVSKITNPLNQKIQFEYDKNGNTTKTSYQKGDIISYTYNSLNRLDGVSVNGTKRWEYTYDANGNVTTVKNTTTGKTTTNSYDKNNRLTGIEESASNRFGYTYDFNSNLTAINITAGSATVTHGYTYNNLNQIIDLNRNDTSVEKFVYDEQGNVISIKRTNGTYTYNQDGIRDSATTSTGSVYYHYNGDKVAYETDPATTSSPNIPTMPKVTQQLW